MKITDMKDLLGRSMRWRECHVSPDSMVALFDIIKQQIDALLEARRALAYTPHTTRSPEAQALSAVDAALISINIGHPDWEEFQSLLDIATRKARPE